MILVSAALTRVLEQGVRRGSYVGDLIVDGDIVLTNIPLEASLSSDAEAKIMTQGTATIQYADNEGGSIVPRDISAWLTPYASYLNVSYRIAAGPFVEKVLRGHMKIVAIPESRERSHGAVTVSSDAHVKLADAFAVTDRERFLTPAGPDSLTSTWAEIARLTGLAVDRGTVTDSAITRQVLYQENRLDAVMDLGQILGGVPYVTPAGAVAIRPDVAGAVVARLSTGPTGTVAAIETGELSADQIYNQTVVRSWDDQQATVLATAEVQSGPLRYGGPFGRVPKFFSSQFITTAAQAQAWADAELPKASTGSAIQFSIECYPDPRLEVGDVVEFEKVAKTGVYTPGRIVKLTLPGSGNMTVVVEVV